MIQIQLTERQNQSRSLDKHNIMSIKTLFYCDSSDAHRVKKKKKGIVALLHTTHLIIIISHPNVRACYSYATVFCILRYWLEALS